MTKTIQVRNVRIGEGVPKIIVPIVGTTTEEILRAAEALKHVKADIVEWRVDHFQQVDQVGCVEKTADALREVLGERPILFTFRTANEGGEKAISGRDYVSLNCHMIKTGRIDLVDVEAFLGNEEVRSIIQTAHENGVIVVASNHDFQKTPPKEELVKRLTYMHEIGADIPKIAVMPTCKADVLTLLSATTEVSEQLPCPIITMSMSAIGLISRLSGETFGSACTFGAVGQASAPGQMNAEALEVVLERIHQSMT